MTSKQTSTANATAVYQNGFTAILDRVQVHAQIHFRAIRCPHRRDDAIQETIALAFNWYVRLVRRGKDPSRFVSALADFAVRAVKSGRRLAGHEKSKDVLSPVAQQRHGFRVEALPSSIGRSHEQIYSRPRGQHLIDGFEERLVDNRQTPIPDQVIFRLDLSAWLISRTDRDRRIIEKMAMNERTLDLARLFGLCPARISQLRREFHDDWARFCGDLRDDQQPTATDAV